MTRHHLRVEDRTRVINALRRARASVVAAAKHLDISTKTLHRWIKAHGLEAEVEQIRKEFAPTIARRRQAAGKRGGRPRIHTPEEAAELRRLATQRWKKAQRKKKKTDAAAPRRSSSRSE